MLFRETLLVERGLRRAGHEPHAVADRWASTLGKGVAIAAPHVLRVVESLEGIAKEMRQTAETSPRAVPEAS